MAAQQRFPVVGIGASAGGVEALQSLFRAMPTSGGLAFVVVTHLGPGRESDLPDILARCTSMPVTSVRDGEAVQPDHVHVLPHDALLSIEGGLLRMRPQPMGAPRERQPIDLFFASLAQDQGERAVAVVLSGSGSDGALGMKAVKQSGGFTVVQGADGTAPKHLGMPTSALATGTVDIVLPVEDIPARLTALARSQAQMRLANGSAEMDGQAVQTAIAGILRSRVGHDFAGYKAPTFMRRVRRRMQLLHVPDADAYVERLHGDAEEASALFRDLLINVTGFFRDGAAFEALARRVLPALFAGRGADQTVRIWVPGCATGEEAYTLAILVREQLDLHGPSPRVQIFATDIDEAALGVARAGRYPLPLLDALSKARLARWFTLHSAVATVTAELRDLCVFSSHSLVRDPPFSRIDLISCRNLLIYLDAASQDRVIPTFHYALRPGGFLFMGSSENVSRHDDLFAPEDKAHRIFRRRDHVAVVQPPRALAATAGTPAWPPPMPMRPPPAVAAVALRQSVESLVLDQFAPAHVVVDRDGDIVLQSGRLGRYIEPVPGVPTRQLLAMARRGLRVDLRAALREAAETQRRVVRGNVEVEVEDRVQPIDLVVTPLPGREAGDALFVVLFVDRGPPVPAPAALPQGRPEDATITSLERELRELREKLQTTIEEYETAVEELRSANEEMVSVNEELQSANEELETAKEEQQSVSEEVQTVNIQLIGKLNELDRANADLHNLFESTRIATIFLDTGLRIRSFTPAVAGILNLIPADRGRLLTDFSSHLDGVDLRAEVRRVLQDKEVVERRVSSHGGARHHLMRVIAYRRTDGDVDGTLLTFVDISNVVETELRLRTLVDELNHRVRNMLQVVTAVARHTLRSSPMPEAFVTTFNGRLRALGRAHELVSREGWASVPLRDLVVAELEPYKSGAGRIGIEGPPLRVAPKAAVALGMAVHELATNAVKYGALSTAQGRVAVTWTVDGKGAAERLMLRWHEQGGPPVRAPKEPGFGSMLIERQLRHDLRGTVAMDFAPDGLKALLSVPLAPGSPSTAAASQDCEAEPPPSCEARPS